jgi:hypothetical protein
MYWGQTWWLMPIIPTTQMDMHGQGEMIRMYPQTGEQSQIAERPNKVIFLLLPPSIPCLQRRKAGLCHIPTHPCKGEAWRVWGGKQVWGWEFSHIDCPRQSFGRQRRRRRRSRRSQLFIPRLNFQPAGPPLLGGWDEWWLLHEREDPNGEQGAPTARWAE